MTSKLMKHLDDQEPPMSANQNSNVVSSNMRVWKCCYCNKMINEETHSTHECTHYYDSYTDTFRKIETKEETQSRIIREIQA